MRPQDEGTAPARIMPACSMMVVGARHDHGEDRITLVSLPDRIIIAIADGAGGATGGAAAAEAVCRATADWCHQKKTADDQSLRCQSGIPELLGRIDRGIADSGTDGLAAAVIIEITDDGRIAGASVGDCEAWVFINGTEPKNLTARQIRKPLLGGGTAVPTGFEGHISQGTLLTATDGLWKYMGRARIAEAASIRPLGAAADALINGARLKSRTLQDDVAVVIVEMAPSHRAPRPLPVRQ